MQRKKYAKEFKLEAVRLLEKRDKPASVLARELGVRRNQLYKWQRQVHDKGEAAAFQGSGHRPTKEVKEVMALKRRIAELEEENDILKKADAYFAKLDR
jgi:transposase